MIKTANDGYWATGITVTWLARRSSGWRASLDFYDNGFNDDNTDAGLVSTQGHLQTRYFVTDGENESGLTTALDVLLTDAQRLGITFLGVTDAKPVLYYWRDGGDEDYPPPVGWKETLAGQAERLGWRTPYKTEEVTS